MLGALWAYDGWNNVAPLAGEIRDPQRNLPRAFIGGTLLVAGVVSVRQCRLLLRAHAAAKSRAFRRSPRWPRRSVKRFLGPTAVAFMAVAMMISSFGSLHASVLSNSRIPYAMAREGLFFKGLARLSAALERTGAGTSRAGGVGEPPRDLRHVRHAHGLGDISPPGCSTGWWPALYSYSGAPCEIRRGRIARPVIRSIPIVFLLATAALIINTFIATPRQALYAAVTLLARPAVLLVLGTAAPLRGDSRG